ncbi:hypothetical protein [Dactylosporangium sp. NPDC000521]|uniref:hypothetical protein n=1 Tax=Dactylosporangium sp. NPDC000521 TaxID=3363975 RepID=UPI0036C0028E
MAFVAGGVVFAGGGGVAAFAGVVATGFAGCFVAGGVAVVFAAADCDAAADVDAGGGQGAVAEAVRVGDLQGHGRLPDEAEAALEGHPVDVGGEEVVERHLPVVVPLQSWPL